ncbi:MAG: type II secretion system protein [Arcobacteraceae bacterium]
MQKKGFSLLEIIFVLLTIAVVVTAAISKFETTFDKTNITKLKSDILQIRAGINLYKNKLILQNQNESLSSLDDNNNMLFNLILQTPIPSSNENKANAWSKISATKYRVYLDASDSLDFEYDNLNYTFQCNITNELCKELEL